MFDIPRDAKTLVDVMARSRLNRRVKLPDVAKFMYDDYTTWVDTVEATAVQKSWGHIILLAYTTKVLQDGSKHDKTLLTMMTKGEAVGYQKKLMFKSDDWNMLHLHVKAGDTRDEGMRQVLQRLFSRSVGLWELLNIPTQELLDMGLDLDKTIEPVNGLSNNFIVVAFDKEQASESSTQVQEEIDAIAEAVRITNSEVDKSDSAITEILPIENLDLNDEEAESGKNKKKLKIAVRLPPRQEKVHSTTTEGEMKAALTKLPSNLQASKWATGSITQGVANEDVIGEKKVKDTSVEYGVPTNDMQTSVPVVEEPKILREVPGEAPSTPQEAERIAAFTPKKQLSRHLSDLQLPVYMPNVYTTSEGDKDSEYASAFSPRHEIPRSTATSPRESAFHEKELATITKDHFAYQDQH